jgi:hypothetical protein
VWGRDGAGDRQRGRDGQPAWWDEHVGANHGGDKSKISDHAILLSADKATELTGFDAVRVSRIRKRLKDPDVYRQQLYGAAWKKAESYRVARH